LISTEGVSQVETPLGTFLKVEPEAITLLTETAMRDIAHLLRSDHLQQLNNILKDPEASPNDNFVALDLLKNASIAAGGVLPMCQDTGTAIVKAKKGQFVMSGGNDEEAIAHGVFNTYQTSNLRYSQMAPISMYEEKNTGNNLPAEIKISAVDGDAYKFLFMAKGGGSANKSYLFQETKALLNEKTLLPWIFGYRSMSSVSPCSCDWRNISRAGSGNSKACEHALPRFLAHTRKRPGQWFPRH
jgi:fumarate hydratase class I